MTGRLAGCLELLDGRQPIERLQPGMSEAAVAVILLPAPDRLLLIRRAVRLSDHWSGHVALPGGRRERGDRSLLDTAIRETAEEVGISLSKCDLRGRLDDLGPMAPVITPILVRPYIFVLDDEPQLELSGEAAAAAWVPLAAIADPTTRVVKRFRVAGTERDVPGFDLPLGFLWGMTERIVAPLLAAWRRS